MVPGRTVGLLGGGQLGRMLALEARRMGYRVGVLDPTPACPAAQVADFHVASAFSDCQQVLKFASCVDVVTVETELVPADMLAEVAIHRPTQPPPSVLAIVQDRLRERQFLDEHGFPQVSWAPILDASMLAQAEERMTYPALLKTARSGYDGKGQVRVEHAGQLRQAWDAIHGVPAVLESVVAFRMELSVILARSATGEVEVFPVAENVHRRHILHTTRVPAAVPDAVRSAAVDLAVAIADALAYCGVMAVELFVLDDQTLLVNEIAPRPHNSGHFTFGACTTSQFEQHLRAICGLPLGDPALLHPVVMGNLLGDLWRNGPPRWESLLNHPRVRLHVYGKAHPRPGRKMGHVLLFDRNTDRALQEVEALLQSLESSCERREDA
ncbi:MAG: 5-(carboxyamino)imidazole ribonucleotide synthase [Nitrospirae bacterium]|nr:MAG: 5-(carboxyamino)imidazole ribonucleotide synthase [Nitrospirota bacterium]